MFEKRVGIVLQPDSEVAGLDGLAVVVLRTTGGVREQVFDFVIEGVVEVRRDILVCELFFDRRFSTWQLFSTLADWSASSRQ
jgi:hypothetical protein